jgi:hypothetical protein
MRGDKDSTTPHLNPLPEGKRKYMLRIVVKYIKISTIFG